MRQLSAAFATIAVVACAQIASAADMPVKAPPPAPVPLPYNWGGLYLGGYVGYLWGRTRVEEDGLVTEPNAATNGVIGGVLAGYNRQAGPGVFGVEGDFGWTDAHGTGLVSNPIIQPNTYDVNWTGQCVAASDMHSTPGFFSLRADLSSPISTFTRRGCFDDSQRRKIQRLVDRWRC
ncbi:MAG: hypothetical protein WBZ35_00965 [Pseudolabrys sp.]